MIQIQNISKSFEGRDILLDVSGEFLPGNTSLIIGGSGTGKSVLLKCMLGLIKPEKGKVLVLGWGSTYGAIKSAVLKARKEGLDVSHTHLRYIKPFPKNCHQIFFWLLPLYQAPG